MHKGIEPKEMQLREYGGSQRRSGRKVCALLRIAARGSVQLSVVVKLRNN